jgi:hypothetical protein
MVGHLLDTFDMNGTTSSIVICPLPTIHSRCSEEIIPPGKSDQAKGPTLPWAWTACIALSAKGVFYETSIAHSSAEDGGRIEAPSEK